VVAIAEGDGADATIARIPSIEVPSQVRQVEDRIWHEPWFL
jgi:hypothetical protein